MHDLGEGELGEGWGRKVEIVGGSAATQVDVAALSWLLDEVRFGTAAVEVDTADPGPSFQ